MSPTQETELDSGSVADDLLSSAARVGELGAAWARLTGGLVISIAWPIAHLENLLLFTTRTWGTLVLGLLALCWSVFVIVSLRRSNPSQRLIYTSITVDAVLIDCILLTYLFAPSTIHQSIVEVHGTAFVYFAIITAGIRFNIRAAYFGAILNSLLFSMMVFASTRMVDDLDVIGPPEWLTVGIGLIASTVLGVNIATRTVNLVRRSADETLRFAKARNRLGAYISPEVADIALQQSELTMGGKRQKVAVLFSDLRGFTRYSERLEPEQIVAQLNDYMSAMVSTIINHGGIVDKFMGDGIMAVFGVPIAANDDADRAVECAVDMMRGIDEHNQSRLDRNLPPIKHGIGIHYGTVIAGNVGTASRAAYTVIGDTVNLASRLEQLTKNSKAEVIVSQQTLAACHRQHNLKKLQEVRVPGREQSVVIFGIEREP
ncbi:MAG: adenylate/guanylate cyclase domain-containing protein [Aureliella sp.]